ncbi:Spc97/Spc98 family protein [Histoplasma capsulatum G186AR]|uniref:Spindle pole body component n=2 Tax=Ajellomyces capsulatus TaxID=5037 RepID=C0NPE3_AJECG|nr:Spc97/Spc98 family protein [Histoplasma capsulatum G186AR]EEH06803.1 Spc97/Spc98 family protein [Histoplasma capsulatum G186AR]KAG5286917.1 Spc97/Spc98 family protein [Histoplasma capsulatum]QSS75623.1 Spc97/Spc98 family protein [Histoplasma capsulatum G186AR]
MLHEILLALSGHSSPLFDQEEGSSSKDGVPFLSPAEHALLQPIAELCRLHTLLRKHTLQISSSHPSTICRAVSTNISTDQLGKFQKQILEVETAVLANDARYVGGHGIVPLSTIRSEFLPWVGRLRWLWQIVRFMSPISGEEKGICTGASLIDHLRNESHTGYLDLEGMALQLINAGETAFMRQLSMFVLYGQLPSFGREDFFIQEDPSTVDEKRKSAADFTIRADLMPNFVSSSTANSILFVGKSLNHIRAQGKFSAGDESIASLSKLTLHGNYLDHLSALSSPITPVGLSGAISKIRVCLSQTALSQLLPLPKIVEILSLLHDFLLLGRGEFAMGLVTFADNLSRGRHRRADPLGLGKDSTNLLENLAVKEGEVTAVLSQTWSELYSLQNEEDPVDDELDLAREILHLSIKGKSGTKRAFAKEAAVSSPIIDISDVPFNDLLFGTPTTLSLNVQPPLDLFLSQADMGLYSKVHSYLLAIRRGQIHLSNLWKLSSLRRTYPAPPLANKRGGQARCQSNRERALTRAAAIRPVWITASRALFILSELTGYMHGEVISNSWQHLKQWLDELRPVSIRDSRPGTAASAASQREISAATFQPSNLDKPQTQKENQRPQHDPETITAAHRAHLISIIQSVFLTDVPFTRTLRTLLNAIDHFIAMIIRLETVQQNLDLETDEGVVDSLADYAAEDKRIMHDLRLARAEVDNNVSDLISRLRDIDDNRLGDGKRPFDLGQINVVASNINGDGSINLFGEGASAFVPWKPAGVDQLLMKLDFFSSSQKSDVDGFEFEAPLT